jgi:dipeptidyl aminopeptidase/acylaminoacyl peptidase
VFTTDPKSVESGYAKVNLKTGNTQVLLKEPRRFAWLFDSPLVAANGRAVVYASESASESSDLWLAGPDFSAPHRLTTLNPQLDQYTFGKGRLIDFRSEDGTPLRGSLLLPAGYEAGKRYPLMVWVYASDEGARSLNRFGLIGIKAYNMHMLTTRGYAVLWPDIPVHVGTPMRDLMKSVMPAIDKVVELGIADPDRLAVMGQSNGGYSTLSLLVQTTRFKGAIMNAGFGDLTGFYGAMSMVDGSGVWHPWLERLGGAMGAGPWEVPQRYVENSPIFYLDRVQTPLIIQAGGADGAIVHFSDQVFVGLKRLGKDVTYLRYGGEGHVLADYANLVDYWNRVTAFLDEKVKGAPIAATAERQ